MTELWTDVAPRYLLPDDHLDYLGSVLGHQTWPVVLAIEPRYDDAPALESARAAAERQLAASGILGDDPFARAGVIEPLVDALSILSNPDRLVEIRRFDATGCKRMCLARSGHRHVFAGRIGGAISIGEVTVCGDDELGTFVAGELGSADALRSPSFSAPAAELRKRLDRAATASGYSDALHAIGAGDQAAAVYSTALESCTGHTEIVAIETRPGRVMQSTGAVAVYDTDRGRIIAGPSMSPDGRVWTTLSAGTPHRISQAVVLLMETLPSRRWMP